MIGSIGEIAFTASDGRVFTFSSLSGQAEARYAEHDVIGKKPKLEFIGPGIKSFSMSIRLDVGLGVNPLTQITNLEAVRDSGTAVPLVIGDNYKGDYVIDSISEDYRSHDSAGRLLLANVILNLKEYAA